MTRTWAFRGVLVGLVVFALGCVIPVTPNDPHDWFFLNEGANGSGYFTNGPGTPPQGRGSALLTIDGTGRENIATLRYKGKSLSALTKLQYSTYVAFTPSSEAPTLQFDVDYDSTDASTGYQGRLVYIPGVSTPVVQSTWQLWDTLTGPAGGTWYSSASGGSGFRPIVGNLTQSSPPCDQANYCTWAEVLSNYPNAQIRANNGVLLVRAGGPTTGGLVAATDNVTVGFDGNEATYDFEPGDGVMTVDPTTAASLNFGFQQETATGSGSFVTGPAGSDGDGSAQLTVDATGGEGISTGVFAGTRISRFTNFQYKTYVTAGPNAPTLQFDIDYDDTDASTTFQGRAVFEPSVSGGTVTNGAWQTWDALTATSGWWRTGTPIIAGVPTPVSPCTQAIPCSWTAFKLAFANARVRPITGQAGGIAAVGRTWLKAGSGWTGGFTGNVDSLLVGIDNKDATYDLEP